MAALLAHAAPTKELAWLVNQMDDLPGYKEAAVLRIAVGPEEFTPTDAAMSASTIHLRATVSTSAGNGASRSSTM
ncbi:hypothetical protein D3C84_1270940 [compost metagenome]